MRYVLLTSILILLAAAPAMGAVTTTDGSDPQPYVQALGTYMSLPSVIKVQPSPGGCPFGPPPRPAACADSNGFIYIDPARVNPVAMTHEVGHLVDFELGGSTIPGYDKEKIADVWAECALEGPNTLDDYIFTPSYSFRIDAGEYRDDCSLLAAREAEAGWDAPLGTPPASWRKQPVPGMCMAGAYVVDCPVAKPARRFGWRKHPWLRRWHWRR